MALEPYGTGVSYVNFLDERGGGAGPSCRTAPLYDRLAAIKARYDPDNLFRSNQNIRPAV